MRRKLPEGYRARFQHIRRREPRRPGFAETEGGVSAKGGLTVVKVFDPEDNLVITAKAVCNPQDSFNKRIGRDISLGRALKAMEERGL